jgi:hypothetical protein
MGSSPTRAPLRFAKMVIAGSPVYLVIQDKNETLDESLGHHVTTWLPDSSPPRSLLDRHDHT